MGLHQRDTHGRVLVGEEALQHLALHRRDSHGDRIVMVVPEGFRPFVHKDVVVDTVVVSQVFVTVPPSSTDNSDASQTADASPTQNNGGNRQSSSQARSTQTASGSHSSSKSSATSTGSPSAVVGSPIRITSAPSSTNSYYGSSYNSAGSLSTSPSSTSLSSSDGNNTSGDIPTIAKAGIAIGAVVGIAMLAGLLFFCCRRRKNRVGARAGNNEKHDSMFGVQQSIPQPLNANANRATSPAPQLSLRPVTQFLPNLSEKRKSGDLLGAGVASKSAWERKTSDNPFADSSIQEKSRPVTPNANPFDEPQTQRTSPKAAPVAARTPPAVTPPVEAQQPIALAAMGRSVAPEQRGANNVHRVQLDFKPSMDDELELRSGQLVRMMHEYDDGWALCVRMDRSQQGVCPRTCLSKLPVKPRQGPPPPNANGRPYGPPNGNGPMDRGSPQGRPRMLSNADSRPGNGQMYGPNQNNGMFPRPLTPTGSSERNGPSNGPPRPEVGQAF